jgi:hypothetical protein
MKRWALLLALAGLCMAGGARKTFTGVIHDNRCVGPNCATQCPINKAPVYTLQSGDEAWVLNDQKTPAGYVGKKVVVTGTLGPGNKLNVISIVSVSIGPST